jgi:hypothetical protein
VPASTRRGPSLPASTAPPSQPPRRLPGLRPSRIIQAFESGDSDKVAELSLTQLKDGQKLVYERIIDGLVPVSHTTWRP